MKSFLIQLTDNDTYLDYVIEGETLLDAIEREWNTAIHQTDICVDILTFDVNKDHQDATAQEIYEWMMDNEGYTHKHVYEYEIDRLGQIQLLK